MQEFLDQFLNLELLWKNRIIRGIANYYFPIIERVSTLGLFIYYVFHVMVLLLENIGLVLQK